MQFGLQLVDVLSVSGRVATGVPIFKVTGMTRGRERSVFNSTNIGSVPRATLGIVCLFVA